MISNALYLYTVQGLNYLVPLIQVPYLMRTLGPHNYGAVILAQALMGYAVVATDYGFNLTAARDISIVRDDAVAVARIYWTTMAAKLLLLLVSLMVIALVVWLTPALRQSWPVIAGTSVMVLGSVAFPQWYFQGLERLRETAAIQGLAKVVTSIAVFTLVRSSADLSAAAFITSSPQLAGVIAACCLGRSVAPPIFFKPTLADIRKALDSGWHMFVSGASITLYGHTNTFVLGLVCGESAVALYNVGYKLIFTLQSLFSPVIQAVYPRASLLFNQEPEQGWLLIKRVAQLLMPAVIVASLLLAIFAPYVVDLVGGGAYAGATSVTRILCVVPMCVVAAMLLAQCVMVNTGLTKSLARIYLLVGLINLAVLPELVWKFAADGAAISLVLAELLGPLLMMRSIWRLPRFVSGVESPI